MDVITIYVRNPHPDRYSFRSVEAVEWPNGEMLLINPKDAIKLSPMDSMSSGVAPLVSVGSWFRTRAQALAYIQGEIAQQVEYHEQTLDALNTSRDEMGA